MSKLSPDFLTQQTKKRENDTILLTLGISPYRLGKNLLFSYDFAVPLHQKS